MSPCSDLAKHRIDRCSRPSSTGRHNTRRVVTARPCSGPLNACSYVAVSACARRLVLKALTQPVRPAAALGDAGLSHAAFGTLPHSSLSRFRRLRQPVTRANSLQQYANTDDSFISKARKVLPILYYTEIFRRVVATLIVLAVVRLGYYIAIPGLDMAALPSVSGYSEADRLVRALYGQVGTLPASLFELGISPFIFASIFINVLIGMPKEAIPDSIIPGLREAKKEGKVGMAMIQNAVNTVAGVVIVVMAFVKALEWAPHALHPKGFVGCCALALTAGACIMEQCSRAITAYGIGNGYTVLIVMAVASEYSHTLQNVLTYVEAGAVSAGQLAVLGGGWLLMVLFCALLCTTVLALPITHHSTIAQSQEDEGEGGGEGWRRVAFSSSRRLLDRANASSTASFLPLLLNSNGIMPLIFGGLLWSAALPFAAEAVWGPAALASLQAFQLSPLGLLLFGMSVAAFEFLPVGGVNAFEVSEFLGQLNVGIKGVAPGVPTTQYVQSRQWRCKFWGAIMLGLLAILAQLFDMWCLVNVGVTLAAQSLIIIVGGVIHTTRQVQSLLEGPRMQQRLEQEYRVLKSLSYL